MGNLQEELQKVKLERRDYGLLPFRKVILNTCRCLSNEEGNALMEQWETLVFILKHLTIIDKYINYNRGETLKEWLAANHAKANEIYGVLPEGHWHISDDVVKAIGEFNNDTKGVTTYFLQLQQRYDIEEAKYDELENSKNIPESFMEPLMPNKEERAKKRLERGKLRAMRFKDMKKNKEGFFVVALPSPEPELEMPKTNGHDKKEKGEGDVFNATESSEIIDGIKKVIEKIDEHKEKVYDATPIQETPKKDNNIAIWIAGAVILVAAIAITASLSKNDTPSATPSA